jgi:predicted transcriptional regulator
MRQPNYQELKKRREAAKKLAKQEKLAKRQGAEQPATTPKDPP